MNKIKMEISSCQDTNTIGIELNENMFMVSIKDALEMAEALHKACAYLSIINGSEDHHIGPQSRGLDLSGLEGLEGISVIDLDGDMADLFNAIAKGVGEDLGPDPAKDMPYLEDDDIIQTQERIDGWGDGNPWQNGSRDPQEGE